MNYSKINNYINKSKDCLNKSDALDLKIKNELSNLIVKNKLIDNTSWTLQVGGYSVVGSNPPSLKFDKDNSLKPNGLFEVIQLFTSSTCESILFENVEMYITQFGVKGISTLEKSSKNKMSTKHLDDDLDDLKLNNQIKSFEEAEIVIYFDDAKDILSFIKKHKLIVDNTMLSNRIHKLNKELDIINKLTHNLGIYK